VITLRTLVNTILPAMQVSFPLLLDMFEHCTPELQATLKGPRRAFRAAEDARQGLAPEAGGAAAGAADASTSAAPGATSIRAWRREADLLGALRIWWRACALPRESSPTSACPTLHH
jgi:hypothetical protein